MIPYDDTRARYSVPFLFEDSDKRHIHDDALEVENDALQQSMSHAGL
jgi:hypothetical protein